MDRTRQSSEVANIPSLINFNQRPPPPPIKKKKKKKKKEGSSEKNIGSFIFSIFPGLYIFELCCLVNQIRY